MASHSRIHMVGIDSINVALLEPSNQFVTENITDDGVTEVFNDLLVIEDLANDEVFVIDPGDQLGHLSRVLFDQTGVVPFMNAAAAERPTPPDSIRTVEIDNADTRVSDQGDTYRRFDLRLNGVGVEVFNADGWQIQGDTGREPEWADMLDNPTEDDKDAVREWLSGLCDWFAFQHNAILRSVDRVAVDALRGLARTDTA